MQNLILKSVVLIGVMGGSGYVVWQAQQGLATSSSSEQEPAEESFAALEGSGDEDVVTALSDAPPFELDSPVAASDVEQQSDAEPGHTPSSVKPLMVNLASDEQEGPSTLNVTPALLNASSPTEVQPAEEADHYQPLEADPQTATQPQEMDPFANAVSHSVDPQPEVKTAELPGRSSSLFISPSKPVDGQGPTISSAGNPSNAAPPQSEEPDEDPILTPVADPEPNAPEPSKPATHSAEAPSPSDSQENQPAVEDPFAAFLSRSAPSSSTSSPGNSQPVLPDQSETGHEESGEPVSVATDEALGVVRAAATEATNANAVAPAQFESLEPSERDAAPDSENSPLHRARHEPVLLPAQDHFLDQESASNPADEPDGSSTGRAVLPEMGTVPEPDSFGLENGSAPETQSPSSSLAPPEDVDPFASAMRNRRVTPVENRSSASPAPELNRETSVPNPLPTISESKTEPLLPITNAPAAESVPENRANLQTAEIPSLDIASPLPNQSDDTTTDSDNLPVIEVLPPGLDSGSETVPAPARATLPGTEPAAIDSARNAPAQIPEAEQPIGSLNPLESSAASSTAEPFSNSAAARDAVSTGAPAADSLLPNITPQFSTLQGTGSVDPEVPSTPQTPELQIEKIAPTNATIGEPIVYAIVVRNVGKSPAHDVIVEDQIPKGTRLEGTIPQAELTSGTLSWQLGTLKPGDEQKIRLKVIPLEPGEIGSVARVSFAASVSAVIQVTAPDLKFEVQAPTEGVLGEDVNLRFVLRNEGQGAAKSVVLRTVLPSGLTHPGGQDLEYEAGSLAPGEEKTIDLALTTAEAGLQTSQMTLSNDGHVYAEDSRAVEILPSRIQVTRTGPVRRFVGRPAEYVTTVTNLTSQPLTGITVRDALPVGLEPDGLVEGGRWDPATREVIWSIPQLASGESVPLTSHLVAKTAGNLTGRLVAEDAAGHRTEVATALEVKGFADLDVDVSSDQRTVVVGDQVSLRLTLKNDGTAAAKDVKTRFAIPQGLRFVEANGPVEYSNTNNVIEFASLNEIAIDDQQSFDVVLSAAESGTSKVTVELMSADYEEAIVQEEAIRVINENP